jgi:uncharacterized protein GlcG (DUF336 family)
VRLLKILGPSGADSSSFCFSYVLVQLFLSAIFTACGSSSLNDPTGAAAESTSGTVHLTAAEVQTIIAQAATQAQMSGLPVTIAVLDHEGTVLGVLRMAGAPTTTTIRGGGSGGLEGRSIPSDFAAISKAGTPAFFSTQGNAFTTRSASFIIQEHFPPQVNPSPGGPLFGVQLSQLRCSDVSRNGHSASTSNLPVGLSGDPGGLPLYKNGTAVGGIGVEGDGIYTIDRDGSDADQSTEEVIAAAGTLGFSAPPGIRGNTILVDGVAIPFANAEPPPTLNTIPFGTFVSNGGTVVVPPIASPATGFVPASLVGVSGTRDPNFPFPFIAGTDGGLTAAEVTQIITQAAVQAETTRAAIRNPLGSPARVSISVVDTNGTILGIFRTSDAPLFGFDVSVQKARTANFFTQAQAGIELSVAAGIDPDSNPVPLSGYASILANEGIPLNGSIAFSDRASGFMSQPIYPPGATSSLLVGPLSKPPGIWSVFNTGLQSDALNIGNVLGGIPPCTVLTRVPNGIQTFPGSVPLYKAGTLVGAIGISGDGVDQDDFIAAAGSAGFEAPIGIRADNVVAREARLPYVVFPRNPTLN